MPVTLGTYGDTGPGGWTQFTLGSGCRIIYVSTSGSDSNNGLTVSAPKQTIAGAQAAMRSGFSDWMLFKRGDTWTGNDCYWNPARNDGVSTWPAYGGTAGNPVVIGSYDPSMPGVVNPNVAGARPRFRTAYQMVGTWASAVIQDPIDNIAIVGLDFYEYVRDPHNGSFAGSSATDHGCIQFANSPTWCLVEDCRFAFYGMVINHSYYQVPCRGLIIRRNIFISTWTNTNPGGDHFIFLENAQGLSGDDTTGVIIQENTMDMVGWQPYVPMSATSQHHCIYLPAYTPENQNILHSGPADISGNFMSRDATCTQMRSGGKFFNNSVIDGGGGCSFGAANNNLTNVTYNVIMGEVPVRDTMVSTSVLTTPPGAYNSGSWGSGPGEPMISHGSFNNNIIANCTNGDGNQTINIPGGWTATVNGNIIYYSDTGSSYPTLPQGIYTGTGSVRAFSSCTGIGSNGTYYHVRMTNPHGGASCYANITVNGGVFTAKVSTDTDGNAANCAWYGGGVDMGYNVPAPAGSYQVSDVLNISGTPPSGLTSVNATVSEVSLMTLDNTNWVDGPGNNTGVPGVGSYPLHGGWSTSNRMGNNTVGKYAESIGLGAGATTETFANAAGGHNLAVNGDTWSSNGQSRYNWQYNLTAPAVNSYIRNGFAMADPGGGVVTVSPGTIPGTGTVGTTYPTQNFSASGGIAPYTWSISSGAVPPGLVFHTATAVLDGIPTSAGSYSFTVQAQDSASTPLIGSQPYSIAVSAAPTITVSPSTLPSGTVNVAYSQNITASGGTAPYTFAMTPSNALTGSGLTLASNGLLSGTPTTATTYSFSVTATDSTTNASAPKAYSLVINPVAVPGPSVRFVHTKK